ncbi:MAG: hypothetical protein Q7U12_15625 [Undibacterium sp.]|nr:hypothetical protein [Undibacterium sp.]
MVFFADARCNGMSGFSCQWRQASNGKRREGDSSPRAAKKLARSLRKPMCLVAPECVLAQFSEDYLVFLNYGNWACLADIFAKNIF